LRGEKKTHEIGIPRYQVHDLPHVRAGLWILLLLIVISNHREILRLQGLSYIAAISADRIRVPSRWPYQRCCPSFLSRKKIWIGFFRAPPSRRICTNNGARSGKVRGRLTRMNHLFNLLHGKHTKVEPAQNWCKISRPQRRDGRIESREFRIIRTQYPYKAAKSSLPSLSFPHLLQAQSHADPSTRQHESRSPSLPLLHSPTHGFVNIESSWDRFIILIHLTTFTTLCLYALRL